MNEEKCLQQNCRAHLTNTKGQTKSKPVWLELPPKQRGEKKPKSHSIKKANRSERRTLACWRRTAAGRQEEVTLTTWESRERKDKTETNTTTCQSPRAHPRTSSSPAAETTSRDETKRAIALRRLAFKCKTRRKTNHTTACSYHISTTTGLGGGGGGLI